MSECSLKVLNVPVQFFKRFYWFWEC